MPRNELSATALSATRRANGRRAAACIFYLLIPFSTLAAFQPAKTPAASVEAAVKNFSSDPALTHAGIGFSLKELSTGSPVYELNGQQALTPASTLKAITTYAALTMLGEGYVFKTTVGYEGQIDSAGRLHGNIVVAGGGDPTLGSQRLGGSTGYRAAIMGMAAALKARGVLAISGNLVIADGRYDNVLQPPTWSWEDIGNYYGAGASAVSINDNQYRLVLKPGSKTGDAAVLLRTEPAMDRLSFDMHVTTAAPGSGDNAYIFGAPYTYHRTVTGTIPMGRDIFHIKGSLPDPPAFFAEILTSSLKDVGIRLTNDTLIAVRVRGAPAHTVVHTVVSPPLSEITKYTNLNSVNLYAEHLLKEMGYVNSKLGQGTTENGIEAVEKLLRQQGLSTAALFMHDGSGLSRANAVTATLLTEVLLKGYSNKPFYNSLPVAGRDKAMRSMGKGSSIEGNMRAKSGHMEQVRSYAGYFKGKDGKTYAFALLVNNYACSSAEIKAKIEKLLVAIAV